VLIHLQLLMPLDQEQFMKHKYNNIERIFFY
jgi:hypothetical protein